MMKERKSGLFENEQASVVTCVAVIPKGLAKD